MADLSNLPPDVARRQQRRQEEMEEQLASEGGGDETVAVCIRVRPFNKRESAIQETLGEDLRSVIEMPDGMGGKVICMERNADDGDYQTVEEFQYTKSFWSVAEDQQPHAFAPVTQEDVFETIGKPILKYAFAGFNNCVFAYGQTGSGKTHTMMGDFATQGGEFAGDPGMIPRLCKELFGRIERKLEARDDDIKKTFDVKLSAIEIYNEQVKDLFWRNTQGRNKNDVLKVRMHPTDGAFVDKLTVLNPNSWEKCIKLIADGVAERTVAATLMNSESSRSHSVFQITLTQTETVHIRNPDDPDADRYSKPVTHKKVSMINLVDLAGSERLKKSGAQGQQLKEAAGINQSLSTLKKVIDALVTNSNEKNQKKHIIVPFRESTLTLLLSHSLGGNSKTTMVACVSPHFDNQEETLLTLRYAARTNTIVNNAKINEDSEAKKALDLKHRILALQKRLNENPRDEEAEEMMDQIAIGRSALDSLEVQKAKAEKIAEETRQRSKQEEGARYAAAFYNSLRMVMLQQQKEQLEEQAKDFESRLKSGRTDISSLRGELEKNEAADRERSKLIERLRIAEKEHNINEKTMDEYERNLVKEHQETRRKLDKEMELRYAQKLVNAHKIKKVRDGQDEELERVQREADERLTEVILKEAEQYERQVRQFADKDTAVQHKITAAEKQIQKLVQDRERAEEEASRLVTVGRERERGHQERLETIERDWKQRYERMKSEYEGRITELEEEHFDKARNHDDEMDDVQVQASTETVVLMSEYDRKMREHEQQWSLKIAQAYEQEGENMDEELQRGSEARSVELNKLRRKYEARIQDLVIHHRRLEAVKVESESAVSYLDRCVGPLIRLHEDVFRVDDQPYASPELAKFRGLLKEYEGKYASNQIASVTMDRLNNGFGLDKTYTSVSAGPPGGASPSPRRASSQTRMEVPPSNFYPLRRK